jgi:hypothetical protein
MVTLLDIICDRVSETARMQEELSIGINRRLTHLLECIVWQDEGIALWSCQFFWSFKRCHHLIALPTSSKNLTNTLQLSVKSAKVSQSYQVRVAGWTSASQDFRIRTTTCARGHLRSSYQELGTTISHVQLYMETAMWFLQLWISPIPKPELTGRRANHIRLVAHRPGEDRACGTLPFHM